MNITYDVATGGLTIETGTPHPFGGIVQARLNRYGQTVPLIGVSFGVVLTAGAETLASAAFPPPGAVFRSTDQDVMVAVPVAWRPDQMVTARAWIETPSRRVEAEASFTVPRPPVPEGLGWVWRGLSWALDLNTADAATLIAALDQVGETRAAQIIAGQPWAAVAGLTAIAGITAPLVADWVLAPGLFVPPPA